MLQDGWPQSDSMNLAMVGIFIPQILANLTNQGSLPPHPQLYPGDQSLQQLPEHNCMWKSVLQKGNSCVVRCVILFSVGGYVCEYTLEAPEESFPSYIHLLAWIQFRATRSGTAVKRLLAVMQVRDEGAKHRKEESGQRNLNREWTGFVIYSEKTRILSFTLLLSL